MKFKIYRNWCWFPKGGHYGFVRIFSNVISDEGKKELRKWLNHLNGGPVFPED